MQAVTPPPLPVHLINLTLQYLLPPTAPMPIHLLSRELLQRHHFLNISPDDPAAYFFWPMFGIPPSSSAVSIIQDLELRAGNEALLNKEVHDIAYEHDDEGSRARVKLADDLDLYVLFVWQGSDEPGSLGYGGWRYYDTKRIPPSTSTSPVVDDDRSPPQVPNQEIQSFHINVNHVSHDTRLKIEDNYDPRSSSPSSDAYWDNYGMYYITHFLQPHLSES
jgi:hypothetical protein